MICSRCGSQIGEDKRYCTNCGAPAPVARPPQVPPPVAPPSPGWSPSRMYAGETATPPFWGKALLGFAVVIVGFFLILSAFLNWYSSSGTMNFNMSGGVSGFNISSPTQLGASFDLTGVNIAANSPLKDVLSVNVMGKQMGVDEFLQQIQQGNPFNGSWLDDSQVAMAGAGTGADSTNHLGINGFAQVNSNNFTARIFSSGSAWLRWVKTDKSGVVFFFSGLWPIAFGAMLLILGLLLLAPIRRLGIAIAVIGMLGFVISLINIIVGYAKLGALAGGAYGMTVTNNVGIGLWLFLIFSVLAAAAGVAAAKYF